MADPSVEELYRELSPHYPPRPPEVDRVTFNYGAAIGAPSSPEYTAMTRYCHALGNVTICFSNAQWRLEMALRAVRCACDVEEQADAMDELRRIFHEVDRELERIEVLPLRFFRYGRIGNILRHFNPFK